MSGGGGYVLSRAAFKKVVEEGLPDPEKCYVDHADVDSNEVVSEDLELGRCLSRLGVKADDSRNSKLDSQIGPAKIGPFDTPIFTIPPWKKLVLPKQEKFNILE
ncbi:glycoprotein-N-acetylgalactosamine 3-beta-galactosyltransferase 1 [Ditylenchus destructor]|uniref:Glycoprotein-N-acetylgalactosamine 3-beta-galactosyltransferase 1 n=1 Tax=Ditylenchus destructor TaxID=166010 RepID=A0AAD4MR75_9BILA|nr:glycoprotein-N-acetylgalactosamine 3-beta-galactosyltransferase 1 [Ditylenchus destructor]